MTTNEMKTTVRTVTFSTQCEVQSYINSNVQTLKALLKHTRNRPKIILGLKSTTMLLIKVQSDNIYHRTKFSYTLCEI